MDGPNNPTHRHALDSNNCQQPLLLFKFQTRSKTDAVNLALSDAETRA